MSVSVRLHVVLSGLVITGLVLSTGCASHDQRKALAQEVAAPVTVAADVQERDALGNYRFLMQQGENRMSADQFDAWMKANGIRVATGVPAPAAAKN